MISADLSGKTALVTGGGSGIGLATVELFAKSGAKVAMNHLPGDQVALDALNTLKGQGLDVISAPGSVAERPVAVAMVKEAIAGLGGRLDILINNAGTPAAKSPIPVKDLEALSDEIWDRVLATNLTGPFNCSRAAAPALKAARGCIVSTASMAGIGRGVGSSMIYSISKAGLIKLTSGLAQALAPEVRVNAVAPGMVRTPFIAGWGAERLETVAASSLLGIAADPIDIAEAMLYLVAGAKMMTGKVLELDAGGFR
jgi:3-oxoacyl-[acyl-carrier protein] reductase